MPRSCCRENRSTSLAICAREIPKPLRELPCSRRESRSWFRPNRCTAPERSGKTRTPDGTEMDEWKPCTLTGGTDDANEIHRPCAFVIGVGFCLRIGRADIGGKCQESVSEHGSA